MATCSSVDLDDDGFGAREIGPEDPDYGSWLMTASALPIIVVFGSIQGGPVSLP
jgi:hypothetical protein